MKRIRRITAALLSVLAVFPLLPFQAPAAGSIDLNRNVSLTISYQDGNSPLVGAKFDIFQVATADEYGELTTTKDFAQFNVNIRGNNDKAWRTLASTLEGYVLRDDISPADSGKTNDKGLASFPTGGKSLTAGLYLVLWHRHTQNGCRYDSAPFMVMLPGLDKKNNTWIYDVTVNAKFDSSQIPDTPDNSTISRKVLKVWADDGHEKARPKEVIVQLLRDGKVYDTVTLNAANNWRYTWTGLGNRYTWTVAEKELEGYTVEVTREGITFVVTNTYNEEIPDEPTPVDPDPEISRPDTDISNPDTDISNPDTEISDSNAETSRTDIGISRPDVEKELEGYTEEVSREGISFMETNNYKDKNSENPTSGDPDSPAQPYDSKPPPTGQLWCPVPVLIAAGLLFVVIGLIRRRGATNGK